jgi:hypothetical protein
LLCKACIGIGIFFLFFQSCKTGDFDLQRFSTSNLKPKVYFPLAFGTYDIKDYLPSFLLSIPDDQTITYSSVQLSPLIWRKGQLTLQPDALDQDSLIITIRNGSPMKAQFEIYCIDYSSKTTYGRSFSGIVAPSISKDQPAINKLAFALTYNDLMIIKNTDGLKCDVILMQPDSGIGVTAGGVKKSQFQIQVDFTTGIYLGKLK